MGLAPRSPDVRLGGGTGLPTRYVELQLRFARRAAELGMHDLPVAVTQLTNLHRRLGLGDPTDTPGEHWARYLDGLGDRQDLAGQVRWTLELAASISAAPPPSAAVARAGPFSAEVHDDLLRTHFVPRAGDTVSPLHASRLPLRRNELRAVLADAVRRHPEVRRVRGTSWLYSTTSYCSIFPPSHISSATVRADVYRFQGSSAWGQFLDHRGGVKADLAARFEAAVEAFDGTAPWRVFPVPTLTVESPIDVFDLGDSEHLVVDRGSQPHS